MKFYFGVFFLVALFGLSVGIIRQYAYIASSQYDCNWYEAQWLCRHYYSYRDLATVSTAEEHQRMLATGDNSKYSWIGLRRTNITTNTWMWSDGEQDSFSKWEYSWTSSYYATETQRCAVVYAGSWRKCGCDYELSAFYCYRFFILVNENKTWEEALQYCTTNYTGLASVPDEGVLFQIKTELALSQTVNVWTGLRFLDGKWFWLNGNSPDTLPSLPSCPARPHHCGAFNIKTNIWENQDCNKKLNFLCYWN